MSTGSASPFSCNVCKKSFTRVDHLARHYRSHTLERPFVCSTCGKSFGRIDLLKRHAMNHEGNDDEDTGDTDPASKRRKVKQKVTAPRASQACRPCAESKLKCDGSHPCSRCQQKSLTCYYNQSRSNRLSEPVTGATDIDETDDIYIPTTIEANVIDITNATEANMTNIPTTTFQLPTPSTFGTEVPNVALNLDDLPLFDFLRDPQTPVHQFGMGDRIDDDFFPRDVLNFGFDLSFDPENFLVIDAQGPPELLQPTVLNNHDLDPSMMRSGMATPALRSNVNVSASTQAFKESIWLWTPEKHNHGASEQLNLSLTWDGVSPDATPRVDFPPLDEKLGNESRGQILAMVLHTCEPAVYSHVVSNFPTAELLTSLVHNFISFHSQQDVVWIHPATVRLDEESPEFLGSMVCYGAAISQVPEIRKLGFAIQEAVRVATPRKFENDNRGTRDLRLLQSFALQLDVGLWGGDRRKMEIAESFSLPLLTMVRRAGHYRRARKTQDMPLAEDADHVLESKWRSWVRNESFKRLALYLFYRDTRSSMSLLTQPLISYAELSLDLPCSNDLWLAKTATEWRDVYMAKAVPMNLKPPSLRSCMDDTSPIFDCQHIVDVELSILLVVASTWPLIWQYQEMKSVMKSRHSPESRHGTLTMNSRHHELEQILKHLQLNCREWLDGLNSAPWLLQEQCMMHLYVSLEDVQLLAGKEGEEEARRAFPVMRAWAESSEARQALFHAGQVVRAARAYPKFLLRDAAAVAVYHASLVFWAYAVLSKAEHANVSGTATQVSVRLDGEDGSEVQRFLMLGRGNPCIERPSEESTQFTQEVLLNEPEAVMNALADFLQGQHGQGPKSCPPLVENLSRLMHSLGNAVNGRRQR